MYDCVDAEGKNQGIVMASLNQVVSMETCTSSSTAADNVTADRDV